MLSMLMFMTAWHEYVQSEVSLPVTLFLMMVAAIIWGCDFDMEWAALSLPSCPLSL
jgi:hypothetical protein